MRENLNNTSTSFYQGNPEIKTLCSYLYCAKRDRFSDVTNNSESSNANLLFNSKKYSKKRILFTSYDLYRANHAPKEFFSFYFKKKFEYKRLNEIQNKKNKIDLHSNFFLKTEMDSIICEDSSFSLLLGNSEEIKRVKRDIFHVKDKACKVLFFGESGTGKSLAARVLHDAGIYSKEKFVSVNVATLQKDLIETTLFGSVKGAYTDALDRKGLISMANGGVMFMDEISELPLDCQAQLLRALDEGIFRKVGSNKEESVNVRFAFATNSNLKELVQKKLFREDLYWRIAEFIIQIPPLRERREDIPLLANSFLDEINKKDISKKKIFSKTAIEKLLRYDWPGNIRELKTCINISTIYSNTEKIDASDIVFN